jgi:Protein of unknown function (DUF3429)
MTHAPMPRIALLLGVAGLVPFLSLAAAIASMMDLGVLSPRVLHMMLITYAALIASFLGGVRWGNALRADQTPTADYIISVIPSLVAWLGLATPRPFDLIVMAGLFLALAVSDIGHVLKGHAPRWYGQLRVGLTAVATLSLLVPLFVET